MGEREPAKVIYFDFSASSDTVLTVHSQRKLGAHDRDENLIDWVQNQLQNHISRTVINGSR